MFYIILFIIIINQNIFPQEKNGTYTIVIHGGAGYFPKDSPEELKQNYFNSLTEALNIGKSILVNGGTSLDAVEKVINYLENNVFLIQEKELCLLQRESTSLMHQLCKARIFPAGPLQE